MTKFIFALALALAGTSASAASVTSTFDSDAEGWSFVNDVNAASGWRSGGYIEGIDRVSGQTWYYVAPSKFLGDKSRAFGQTLTYDLRIDSESSPFDDNDIVLSGGGLTILGDHGRPGTSFTPFSVALDSSFGWTLQGGGTATDANIRTVLSSLTSMWIRGEFRSGSDTGALDNVVMNLSDTPEVPLPATAFLMTGALAGLGAARRLRR